MIFAVFDVLLAVNMCINYSFFYIYNNNNQRTSVLVQRFNAVLLNDSFMLEHHLN